MNRGHETFEEFWIEYLGDHSNTHNRMLHVVGTTAAVLMGVGVVAAGMPQLVVFAPLLAYGPAWFGHFVIERNKPTAFRRPLWSIRADFRMTWLALTGQLQAEMQRIQSMMLLLATAVLPLADCVDCL